MNPTDHLLKTFPQVKFLILSSWIDALCINQYDNPEKERQVPNMFHIYRKASTVLVWLGPAGPYTSLGADIVNYYDGMWPTLRYLDFGGAIIAFLSRKRGREIDVKVHVDEFLHDLQEKPLSNNDRGGADTLELLSMALDGIIDMCGRAWLKRTWIIQEFAAASNIEFHCGQSALSYDAFTTVMPRVGDLIWGTRNLFLAGEEATRQHGDLQKVLSPLLGWEQPEKGPDSLEDFEVFIDVLDYLRLLVNDPAHYIRSRCTQTELMLGLLVKTVSQGFEVSIAVDRLYSMMAMADWISSHIWGLRHNKRVASSPQKLPVDYSVSFRDAVLRALKIRMNEVGYFYVAIHDVFSLETTNVDRETDRKTKEALFSMCKIDSSMPSWLRLLEFNCKHLQRYLDSVVTKLSDEKGGSGSWAYRYRYPLWIEQDTTDLGTLLLPGKALGRLVVDSEKRPSVVWVALPCPLGQGFENALKDHESIRYLHQGAPYGQPAPVDELRGSAETDSHKHPWSWQFPQSARDGDVVVVLPSTCALLRPVPSGKFIVVQDGLRVPVRAPLGSSEDSLDGCTSDLEYRFLYRNHRDDLEDFLLI